MKLTIFAILLLAFMVSLTMVQVESNIEAQFEALSAAEMQATQGFGECEKETKVRDVGDCTSLKCTDITLMGAAIFSKEVEAIWHFVCGTADLTKDCITLDEDLDEVFQICTVMSLYAWGDCDPANLIGVYGQKTPALLVVNGCKGPKAGTSS